MGLFKSLFGLDTAVSEPTNRAVEKELDEELAVYSDTGLTRLDSQFTSEFLVASVTEDCDAKIAGLRRSLKLLKTLKLYCNQSKRGQKWFDEMYGERNDEENPHPSQENLIYRQIKDTKNRKERQQIMLANAQRLKDILKAHSPILQKDIYDYLPELKKEEVRNMLYALVQAGEVKKVKKGSTYEITIAL